jgi:cytochrome c-type biogenesis protein CcmH
MIWLYLAAIACVALAPLAWFAGRGLRLRGRRDAALALHRAQLTELDRDLAEGRLMPAEHGAARLEVQRRLLAEADRTEAAGAQSGPFGLVLVAALVPAAALVLYVAAGGAPDFAARARAAGEQARTAAADQEAARDADVVARLRAALAGMDPHTETARRGYVMLGRAELSVGHLSQAADAWRQALAQRFEPDLGAETAEAITEAEARVTPEAASLFKRALAEAPPDVKWRSAAEKRVAEATAH